MIKKKDQDDHKTSAACNCFYSMCFLCEGIKHTQPAVASDLCRFVHVFGHAICVKRRYQKNNFELKEQSQQNFHHVLVCAWEIGKDPNLKSNLAA